MSQPTLEELKEWRAHPVTKFLTKYAEQEAKNMFEQECNLSFTIEEIGKNRIACAGFIEGLNSLQDWLDFHIKKFEKHDETKKQEEDYQSNFTKNNHFRSKPEGYIR
jgi:hypothetical protein